MEQSILDQLSECLACRTFEEIEFPFWNDDYQMTDCKEVAMRREITAKYVLIHISDAKLRSVYIRNFKQLSALFNIPVKIEEFVVVSDEVSFTCISITGWWSKNLLSRELCRLLCKSCYQPYKSIDDFFKNSLYVAFFACSAEVRRFFLDLKKNAEAQSGVKLSKAPYSGFFTWMKNGVFNF